ncbi:MAG: hypothetical protein HC771_13120 [Synechococcales cyanobacterium CRU_2_2]|nr:hypothetical protein [Synechococcales cyanobacterium CRU_2_2]
MPPEDAMIDRQPKKTVSISPAALADFETVAAAMGKPVGALMRELLEETWRSPSFASLLRRCEQRLDQGAEKGGNDS